MTGLTLMMGDTILESYGLLVVGIGLVYELLCLLMVLGKFLTWWQASRGKKEIQP